MRDESSSGFVYGFTSFVEKVICGGVIMMIQFILDKRSQCTEEQCDNQDDMAWFYRLVVGYGIGVVTILAELIGVFHRYLVKWQK